MTALATLMPGFEGTELPEWVERRLRDGLGGVCLFATNVQSPRQLRALTDAIYAANPLAIISIDEEGGDVSRLYQRDGSPFPGNAVLGRLDDEALTRAVGVQVGRELHDAGVNLTLAPDVDVNSNASNPVIGVRSFGATPELVGRHGVAWAQGVQSVGVAANAKHFPGHGDTAQDSHLSLPTVDADRETLLARELAPFAAAIAGGIQTIMSSHIMVPALDAVHPATFSPAILTDLLRGEMGFDGVIVSDALDMVGASGEIGIPAAAVTALAAGCDLLCIGTANTDEQIEAIAAAVEAAVDGGDLARSRVDDAATRVRGLAAQLRGQPAASALDSASRGRVAGLDAPRVSSTFAITAGAATALERLRSSGAAPYWVRLEPAANIAVGSAPWGPFAAGETADATIEPGGTLDLSAVPDGATLVIVGKDNHRHPWARAAIDGARERGAIVVDMGWPDLDQPYADIATFGASRLVGAALREVLA